MHLRFRLPDSFRPPAVVWALAALGFFLSVTASLVLPSYLGFDEPQHVDMVASIAYGDGWPGPGHRAISVGVDRSSSLFYSPGLKLRPLDEGLMAVGRRGHRPSLGDLGGDSPRRGLPNQIVQHPPLYYAGEALVVKALGALDWPYDRLVSLCRLLTALVCAPLPVLAWGIAHKLRAGSQTAVAAAALSVGLPGLTRDAGLVNNDAMLVVSTTALLLALTHVATGDLTRRTGVVVGLLLGLALLSKGFALTFPALVVMAYLLGMRTQRRRALLPFAWALGVGFVTGGLWWVRNLLLYGALQPSGFGDQLGKVTGPKVVPRGYIDTVGFWNIVQDRLTRTFWAGVGIADQPTLTKHVGTMLLIVLGVMVLLGVLLGVRGHPSRGALILLLLPIPLVFVLVVNNSWQDFVDYKQTTGLQGRYFYCGVSGLAVITAVLLDRVLGRLRSALPLLAVGLVLYFQYVHMARLTNALWLRPGQSGGIRASVKGLEVIAPWDPAVVNAVFAATALSAVAALLLAARGMFARPAVPERQHQQSNDGKP